MKENHLFWVRLRNFRVCRVSSFESVLAVLLLVSGAAAAAGSAPKPTVKSIGDQVYCMCGGCVAILNHCPHLPSECSSRAQMENLIQREIAQGKDETAILQDLVLRYGVQVLATPPAKGFNLTAWVLPGFGLIAGLAVVIAVVRRWRKRPTEAPATSPSSIDPKVMAAMDQEMRKAGVRD